MYRLRISAAPLRSALFSTQAVAAKPQINAIVRAAGEAGSRKSRYLRAEGKIPGVLYGTDDDGNVLKRMISIDKKELAREMRNRQRSFENTIYELKLSDNSTHIVTPRQLQVNPLSDEPVSVNFLRYVPGNRMRIPIEFVNADQSVDLRRGSFVVRVNRFVECVCDGDIPDKVIVDLTGVAKGDVMRLGALQLPPGVRPSVSVPQDFIVAVIRSAKGK